MTDAAVTHPKFHHVNLKTTRLQEMIDWYGEVVGTHVVFQDATGAWLSNDGANHRVALLAFPGFADDPEKETRTGMHHSAFEFAGFEELNGNYLRLRERGITPEICLDHGMTPTRSDTSSMRRRSPRPPRAASRSPRFTAGRWPTSSPPRSPR